RSRLEDRGRAATLVRPFDGDLRAALVLSRDVAAVFRPDGSVRLDLGRRARRPQSPLLLRTDEDGTSLADELHNDVVRPRTAVVGARASGETRGNEDRSGRRELPSHPFSVSFLRGYPVR